MTKRGDGGTFVVDLRADGAVIGELTVKTFAMFDLLPHAGSSEASMEEVHQRAAERTAIVRPIGRYASTGRPKDARAGLRFLGRREWKGVELRQTW